jgi:hypothetical protein
MWRWMLSYVSLVLYVFVIKRHLAEGARFENPEVPETIGPDRVSSVQSQSLTDKSEVDETPIKPDRTR